MKPVMVTERTLIRAAPAKWRETYLRDGVWRTTALGDSGKVYERLSQLDLETCTAADVKRAIGNDSWTRLSPCDACGSYADDFDKYPKALVRVGQEPDYESATASLCYRCVKEAFEAFDIACEHVDCVANPTTLGRACAAAMLLPSKDQP